MSLLKNVKRIRPYICASCMKSLKQRRRTLVTASQPDIYDVVCVGGGPAGLSLLTALRASNLTKHLRLALVDAQDLNLVRSWQLASNEYSNRASSLTSASVAYLSETGAWPHVDTSRVQSYHHMRVWDGLSLTGRISFDNPVPKPAIAYMTENQNLTRGLLRRLDEIGGLDIFDQKRVAGIHLGGPRPADHESAEVLDLSSYPHVELSSNRTLIARLLVGADGLNSPVRTFAGIPTRGWDYARHGVVATLKTSSPVERGDHGAIAYQRFLPTGPIALLPMANGYASLVWTTTPERAAHLKTLSAADFLASVNAAFRLSMVDIDYMAKIPSGQADEFQWRLSVNKATLSNLEIDTSIPPSVESLQQGSVASFPLRFRHASTYVRPRTALIGDAAHTMHPLAGQGLNIGLSDSRSLSSVISMATRYGADIGDELQCLNSYNANTWMTNSRMLGAVDKLHWLYSASSAPIVALRGLGLGFVDWTGSLGLKSWFMKQAGGA